MTRGLLCGRAGSGKTHHCLDLLVAALRERKKALLLVPTYGQAEHLRLRLLDRTDGLRARAVLTFSSLAEHVLDLRLAQLVPEPVRDRVAAALLEREFPEAAGKPGFRAEFLRTVKEISSLGLETGACLEKALVQFDAGSREARLFQAYAGYLDALPGPDHETLLLQTRDALAARSPKLDLLLVDGFHDFTPIERQILDLLAECADECVITLPLDPDDTMHPVFSVAARTADSLDGYRRDALRGNRRASGALAELERRLFSAESGTVPGDGIELIACASEADEADRLARRVASSSRPPSDFLLLRRSFDGLHGLYRAAFLRHGIPLRFFGTEPTAGSPAARAASLWLRLLAGGANHRDLLPLLRSPYLLDRPPGTEVDAFAAALREVDEVEDLSAFPSIGALLGPHEGALPLLWQRIGVRDALLSRPDGDEDLARAHRLFGQLRTEVQAVADLPLAEAADQVLRRLPLLRTATPDRRHDCVYAVTADDARQWERPVVLVAGLGARSFPRPSRQDLFLRDEARQALSAERGLHLPLRGRRDEEERYLFYVALTRAREELVLSYPGFDEEGTAQPASAYLEDAVACFEPFTRRMVPLAEQYVQASDAIRTADLLPIVADGLARAHRGEGALAAALHDREAVPRAVLALPRRLELSRTLPVRPLPAGLGLSLSASSINRYLRCPFLYLISKLLKVEAPREPGLNPSLRGLIVHEVLERLARGEGEADDLFEEVFSRETARFRLGLDDDAQSRWMRAAVRGAAERMRGEPVESAEHFFEFALGDVTLRGRIDRIDRYGAGALVRDYKTGRPELKQALAFEDVQLDTYLLAVPDAAGAVYERLRRGDSTGFVLEELKDVFSAKSVRGLTPEELEARREAMRGIVAGVSSRIRAGALAVHPRDPESCTRTRCDGFDLCRVARAQWLARNARMRKAEA